MLLFSLDDVFVECVSSVKHIILYYLTDKLLRPRKPVDLRRRRAPPHTRVVTLAWCYIYVKCVTCVKPIILLRKITEVTNSKCSSFASSTPLHLFSLQLCGWFLLIGGQNYFCPYLQGTPATPLRTREKGKKIKIKINHN